MGNANFYFQHPWLIALAFGCGLLYAILLYAPKQEWSKTYHSILFSLRFIVVFIIVLLLAGPISRFFDRNVEKPEIVIGIDNSYSIKAFNDSTLLSTLYTQVSLLKKDLEKKGITTRVVDLNAKACTLSWPSKWTQESSISLLMDKVKDQEENRNFKAFVLISDGIYNKGINPLYQAFNTPIYCIGLGDTIPQKDVKVKNLLYNKISYKGNLFPVHADISYQGLQGQTVNVSLKNKDQIISSQKITFKQNKGVERVSFQTSSKEKGLLHLIVEVSAVAGEKNTANNKAHAYIEVIDNKEKILICAATVHPDIKAIRSALDKKDNIETILFVPGLYPLPKEKVDLIIFHQIPNVQGLAQKEFLELLKTETPKLFIIGNQTNLALFNQSNNVLSISQRSNQKDLAAIVLNTSFTKFDFPDNQKERWTEAPPLQVPFGDYKIKSEADVILYQRIGKVNTSSPLLLSSSDRKTSVLCGEGIWWWRLNEASKYGDTEAFDKLINNLVQYLSSKEDKRKFKVFPVNNEFTYGESAIFHTEIYNDIYEPIYDIPFEISLISEKGETLDYKFVHSANTEGYAIRGLKSGIYKYTASTELNKKKEQVKGEFLISEELTELLESTADHRLLKELSAQSKGKFFLPQQTKSLFDKLLSQEYPYVLHATEGLLHWIKLTWILWILILLASAEWALRKYKGVY